MANGVELTYESGNFIRFDGERIEYYYPGREDPTQSTYMYFEEGFEPFWAILSEYTEDGREFHSPFYSPYDESTWDK